MLVEVPRFHRAARALLATPAGGREETLGEFVARGRYSAYFVDHFVKPVVACVWSCSPETALAYPARYLFAFLSHHGMLTVTGSPPWRTVTGGSRSYVEKVAKDLSAVHTATPVRALARTGDGVEIRTTPTRSRASTPRSSPPTRTRRCPCSPSRPRSRARCSGQSGTRRTTRCSTPTPRRCPGPRAPRPPGTTGWRRARRRRSRWSSATT